MTKLIVVDNEIGGAGRWWIMWWKYDGGSKIGDKILILMVIVKLMVILMVFLDWYGEKNDDVIFFPIIVWKISGRNGVVEN